MVTSDDDSLITNVRGDSVCYNIINLGMHLLMNQPAADGLLYHRIRHGMWEMLFQTGSDPQHLILVTALESHHISYRWLCLGQGPRLIKNNSVCICNGF